LRCDGEHVNAPLSDDRRAPSNGDRRVLHATCTIHSGATGFTNLVVTERGGVIFFDPHATGACIVTLDEPEARKLAETLTGWLG
jgi:hypothetical protein